MYVVLNAVEFRISIRLVVLLIALPTLKFMFVNQIVNKLYNRTETLIYMVQL